LRLSRYICPKRRGQTHDLFHAHFPLGWAFLVYSSGSEITEEVIMPRLCARIAICVFLVSLLGGGVAMGSDVGFSGFVGLGITYTPVPPTSFNIGADLVLAFDVSGFSFGSETGFDLIGFQSQRVTLGVDLGAVQISEEILFDPYFAWNELSIDMAIAGVDIGVDFILANIGSVQTPTYSMGAVIGLSSGIVCGFSISSLTGFGAIDLVNILGGIEAPFSYEMLYLFNHLDTLCTPPPGLDVTIVPNFYFEEELVRLEADFMGMIASNTTWFDYMGLSRMLFEFGYRFEEPLLGFLAALGLDGSFVITDIDFIVDLQIDVVRFTSHTWFEENPLPGLIPIVFGGQGFAASFELCGVLITTETGFGGSLLFAQQLIGIEATFDPVSFRSLTTFDATGFAGQCVYADVTICGAKLYTKAEFDFSGISLVTFGFDFSFGS
jgi:hypothetical protein